MYPKMRPAIGRTIPSTSARTPSFSFLMVAIRPNTKAATPKNGGRNSNDTPANMMARVENVLLLFSMVPLFCCLKATVCNLLLRLSEYFKSGLRAAFLYFPAIIWAFNAANSSLEISPLSFISPSFSICPRRLVSAVEAESPTPLAT